MFRVMDTLLFIIIHKITYGLEKYLLFISITIREMQRKIVMIQ